MLPAATKSTTLVSLATFKQWLQKKSGLTKVLTSLTSSGVIATATLSGHGYSTGDFVQITGANESEYNGFFLVTVLSSSTFIYTMPSDPGGPATGTPTVTPDDGRYAQIADAATAEIENDLSLAFVRRQFTQRFSGDDKITAVLDYTPVISIDSFTIDGGAVDPSAYYLDTVSGMITFVTGAFYSGSPGNVIIQYTAGYDVQDGANLPSDIVRAALDLGKAMHDELVSNTIAATSVSLGPSSIVLKPAKVPPSVQRTLDNWQGEAMRP